MQSTATAALQPPTQAEIQRATEDTARAPAGPETGVAPISIGVMALWIASILIFVSALVFLTGRDPRKPRRD